ncbi:MAG: alpha/beta fold hydrolase [Chthoniobacterales bacterium]|nr:alpha/beta fold hydrolase [Chthoniobacterales bacterium]
MITIDLRGFGRSTAPSDFASIHLYTTDVLGLLDFLKIDSAIIGGHSMGGAITLEMYRLAPQRFRGMILLDPVAFPPPTVEQFLWRRY